MRLAMTGPESSPVLGEALRGRAEQLAQRSFIHFFGSESWTYAQAWEHARRAAGGFHRLGVRRGDRIMVFLPNGPDIVRVWFGANLLGATFVPVNIAYRGKLLEHVIANVEPEVAVIHADLVPRLDGISLGSLKTLVVVGSAIGLPTDLTVVDADVLSQQPVADDLLPNVRPWDVQSIVFTSGTTGPSKGVLSSYEHLAEMSLGGRDMITAADHRLVTLPLFHSGGMLGIYGTLLIGGEMTLTESFRTDTFWKVIRQTEATTVTLLGAMIAFLLKAPPSDQDRNHTLRTVFLVPLPASSAKFARRFGVRIFTNYNSTETCNTLVSEENPQKAGLCGRPRADIDARIVDENDIELPAGRVGELVLRTSQPWKLAHGYNKNPEATASAWRNGWFHTGDLFLRDEAGDFYFMDRKKDAIRRRGENISSREVESEILAHGSVLEAAVVGVPSEFGEEEVLAVLALRAGQTLDPSELILFLHGRMAHFMIPRYVRIVDSLPKTPTHKIEKYVLRKEGLSAGTWDRQAAGISIKREKIGMKR
jgi:crotonobetaine/carnitine-CoA ligase